MKNQTFLYLFGLIVCLIPFDLTGQERFSLNDVVCSYFGETIADDLYSFSSSDEARDVVKSITDQVGLSSNFEIKVANVPNAAAVIREEKRYILYSESFMQNIVTQTGTNWANYSILAHEVGHHLEGHTLGKSGSQPELELLADKFSGFILGKLGADLSEAQAVMGKIATDDGSATHPPKSARLEAIAVGWRQANPNQSPVTPPPTEPVVQQPEINTPQKTPISTTNPSTTLYFNYLGNAWIIHTADIYITVGGTRINPQQNQFQLQVPKGQHEYNIEGIVYINLYGIVTSYNAKGSGTLYADDGSVFNLYLGISAYGEYYFYIE
jgi:hypothetical protein